MLPLQGGGGALGGARELAHARVRPGGADADAARALVAEAVQRARRRVDISFLPRTGTAAALAAGIGGR